MVRIENHLEQCITDPPHSLGNGENCHGQMIVEVGEWLVMTSLSRTRFATRRLSIIKSDDSVALGRRN
jgi:hypothetical protein